MGWWAGGGPRAERPVWQKGAFRRPGKILGVLRLCHITCPWAPPLPPFVAFWPACPLQLHSKHQYAAVDCNLLHINSHGAEKVACAYFFRVAAPRHAWTTQRGRSENPSSGGGVGRKATRQSANAHRPSYLFFYFGRGLYSHGPICLSIHGPMQFWQASTPHTTGMPRLANDEASGLGAASGAVAGNRSSTYAGETCPQRSSLKSSSPWHYTTRSCWMNETRPKLVHCTSAVLKNAR